MTIIDCALPNCSKTITVEHTVNELSHFVSTKDGTRRFCCSAECRATLARETKELEHA